MFEQVLTAYWIGFGGDLTNRLIGNAGFPKEECVRSVDMKGTFARQFAAMIADLLDQGGAAPFAAAARIPLLVALLVEAETAAAAPRPGALVTVAQAHIMEHQAEIIDFQRLADSLGLSYRSFRYLFTKETGLSPLQYQLERRLTRAKILLVSSEMPVKDIARTLGFNSTWYFTHFFKKETTLSPIAYRTSHPRSHQ